MKKNTNNSSKRLKEKGIVMACSGASDVGELTDKIARKLGNNGAYQMKCLAMLSADKKSLIESLQQTKTLVIDGCEEECGKKIMEEAWLSNYQYVKLTNYGYVKGQTKLSQDILDNLYDQVMNLDEENQIIHQNPISDIQCDHDSCDMFEFMSDYVGLKILHPGGKQSTLSLLNQLPLDKSKKILEIACGKGRTAVSIAKKYGCRVIGIDILEDSIKEARKYAKKNKIDHLVSFQVADAHQLPFRNKEFDVTIAQAMLILVEDKLKVINETSRVLKNGGTSGWLELSWKKKPTNEFIEKANEEICAACISNAETFTAWEDLFRVGGYNFIKTTRYNMNYRGMLGMMKDEGLVNGLKVMSRFLLKPHIRKRMQRLDNFFRSYPDYTGYGMYISSK